MRVLPPRLRRLKLREQQCRGPPRTWNRNKESPCAHIDVAELPIEITEVWRSNLEQEFHKISWALRNGYCIAALDTEFPGSPFVPEGVSLDYRNRSIDDHYAVMKMNVDRTKVIQIGITLTDEFGNLPYFGDGKRVVWEFNLSDFDVDSDECDKDSVTLLERQGIDFKKHKTQGISTAYFAHWMCLSGLVGLTRAWVTFQGGVDLAYLLKMLLKNSPLPSQRMHFNAFIYRFFGQNVFDLKHMMIGCKLFGGLEKLAATLNVKREAGQNHRAGSDSMLTTMVFQKFRQVYFQETQALDNVAGKLHNLV